MLQVSKQSFLGGLCSDRNTFSRTVARAKRDFFSQIFFFAKMINLFYRSKCQNRHFEVPYVVSGTHFRALRARGAREAGFFFTDQFLLMRRFQRGIIRPWESPGSVFYSEPRQAWRRDITKIYI